MRRSPTVVLVLLVVALLAAALTTPTYADAKPGGTARHGLRVTPVVGGLDHPWDVVSLGGGRLLVSQRDRAVLTVVEKGRKRRSIKVPHVWVSGETGLMGLEVDPDFARNRRIYTCQGGFAGGGSHDVRVVAWTLSAGLRRVTDPQVLVSGFPTSTGRHGGCRLLVATDGSMYVGTGDAAQGANPEDLTSLGGKVLRLDRTTGAPWPTNPFVTAADPAQRYVQSYGHRNVQGLAQRADGTVWSIEQGTDRDDEVNRLVDGGDYGYNPRPTDGRPGYNESVPMTDQGLPGTQVEAAWRSGNPTVATSGGTFVNGRQWGPLDGALAVAVQKDEEVLFISFSADGALRRVRAPAVLKRIGRVRTAVQIGRDLYVTTDNGDGGDRLYRVSPS